MKLDRNIVIKKHLSKGENLDFDKNDEDQGDNYYNRLVKLIPAEVIAFYLSLDGIVSNMPNKNVLLWIVFLISILGTWLYIKRVSNINRLIQQLLTVLSFIVWVFVIGGPFQQYSWYDVNYGKILVTVYTFFIPLIYNPRR